jgi:hypothetical protein
LAKEEQQILLQLGYGHLLNPKHEIPAFAEAASRRQAKFETMLNDKISNVRNKNKFKTFEFWKFGFVSD